MNRAIVSDVNAYKSNKRGSDIHIAVVDSILNAPSNWEITIDFPENYVASDETDTTGHGTRVLDLISLFAPESIYKPLRVVAGDEKFKPSNFLKAMDDVRNANIDLVHISAGKYHENCGGRCRICEAVELVIRDGSVVVAGAGNRKEDRSLDVFCPARSPSSLAVGMSETLCTTSIDNPSLPVGADSPRPPGAYWVDVDSDYPFYPTDTYCSYQSCSPFHECKNNRKTRYWEGNVDWDQYIPEVVAPGHKPLIDTNQLRGYIEPGTSYSAAVVSGGIAIVMSELFPDLPSPGRMRRAIETTALDLDCGIVGKFNMKGLRDALS